MSTPTKLRGRRRLLDAAKKTHLCELIAQENYSVAQAAEALAVSLRTVQRERNDDHEFDEKVRQALVQHPNPLKLLAEAAKTHWRAAAWLLERTNPEVYARKPANATNPKRVTEALRFLQEAALAAVSPESREALYHGTQAALEQALHNCFPLQGRWGEPSVRKLPFKTPLTDAQVEHALPSPKTAETTEATKRTANERPVPPTKPAPSGDEANLSPKIAIATNCEAPQPLGGDDHLTDDRFLRRLKLQERQKNRAAEKKIKAARKRTQSQRRRAA